MSLKCPSHGPYLGGVCPECVRVKQAQEQLDMSKRQLDLSRKMAEKEQIAIDVARDNERKRHRDAQYAENRNREDVLSELHAIVTEEIRRSHLTPRQRAEEDRKNEEYRKQQAQRNEAARLQKECEDEKARQQRAREQQIFEKQKSINREAIFFWFMSVSMGILFYFFNSYVYKLVRYGKIVGNPYAFISDFYYYFIVVPFEFLFSVILLFKEFIANLWPYPNLDLVIYIISGILFLSLIHFMIRGIFSVTGPTIRYIYSVPAFLGVIYFFITRIQI